jgi:carbonic anhydrase
MNILAVLEYAIDVLHVRHVIVAGHYDCGGVQRAMIKQRNALVDHWLQPLSMYYRKHRPAFEAMDSDARRLDRLCEINIEMQVRRVAAMLISTEI